MNLIKEINTIHAMLAKSSISEFEFDEISKRLVSIKRSYSANKIELIPEEVCGAVREYFGLKKGFHTEKTRKRDVVIARQIAVKIILDNSSIILQKVADYFNQGHANILYSKRNIENLIETDRKINVSYVEILEIINRK